MSWPRSSWDVDPLQSHPSDLHDSSPVAADSGSCAPAKPAESSGIGEGEIEQERKDREEAGMEFVDLLLDLKVKGKLSAKDVCTLCWHAKHAGAQGPAQDLAFRPDAPTGHFQRHLDTCTGVGRDVAGAYTLTVPGHDKYSLSRVDMTIPCLPLHETLAQEVQQDTSLAKACRSQLDGHEWSANYMDHPLVKASGDEAVHPLGLYVDGVPFLKKDSLLAFYGYHLVSGRRHLLVVLRKSQMCQCGCLGWCTISPVLRFLAWSFTALAAGRMPQARHNGQAFASAEDSDRKAKAGQPLLKALLVHLKGDWSEFCHTLGFPAWNSTLDPCFCCHATQDEMRKLGAFSVLHPPFPEKDQVAYEEACAACEVWVELESKAQHQVVLGSLFYDKRKRGSKGRSLSRDIPALKLLQGDRLEPSKSLENVGHFEDLEPPCTVLFWRPGNQTLTLHRNPLFCKETSAGVGTLSLDTLHTLHLGVYQGFCQTVLWALIQADVWSVDWTTREELVALSVMRCKGELWAWYSEQKRLHPTVTLYPLQDLRPSMLGSATSPTLATKAAETGTLLGFCKDMVDKYKSCLQEKGPPLQAVGTALVQVRDCMRTNPRVMQPAALQALCDNAKRAFVLRHDAGIPWVPKWHMLLHICQRARCWGNPQFYSTFLDEDFNRRLASLAAVCHKMTWHQRVLNGFRFAFTQPKRKREPGE